MSGAGNLRWRAALVLGLLLAPGAEAGPSLSLPDAVLFALEHNPELATLRQQNGIAAAAVVIAHTYPFNPVWQALVLGDNGPESAGVTNRVFNEHVSRIEVECRGQGKHRRAAAQAALSRTEWEVGAKEVDLAIRVARAFQAVIYQRERLRLVEEARQYQESAVSQVTRLVEQGRLGRADLLLARADLGEARAIVGPVRTALDQATSALRRLLGVIDEEVVVEGELTAPVQAGDAAALTTVALDTRPDVKALRLAIEEAEARVRLEVANRFGNPALGPGFEYNETRAYFVGVSMVMPLPVFNQKRGEILQRQAERDRSVLALRQAEVQVQQDVRAALLRLADAEATVQAFAQSLHDLDETRTTVDKLFAQGEPGVDLSKVLEVRRRILRARAARVDALWELSQAHSDLAAAVGDPSTMWLSAAPGPPDKAP